MTATISPLKIRKAIESNTVVMENGEIFFYPKNQNRGIIEIVRPNGQILNDMPFTEAMKIVIEIYK